MSHSTAILIGDEGAFAVTLAGGRSGLQAEGGAACVWQSASAGERGRQLAEALRQAGGLRGPVAVALSNSQIDWQPLTLPPCPDDDLPAMVRLQLQREPAGEGDAGYAGVDFVSLAGDPTESHQLLVASVSPQRLAELREMLAAAKIKAARLVPEPLGWVSLLDRHPVGQQGGGVLAAAIGVGEVTLWVKQDQHLIGLRSLQAPGAHQREAFASFLANQLKRTRLALGDRFTADKPPRVVLIGPDRQQLEELAADVSFEISDKVVVVSGEDVIDGGGHALPALALAADEAEDKRPAIDLLNPHRPPQRSNRRVPVLAAVALVAALALGGFQCYRFYKTPLDDAATADAERAVVEKSLESFSDDLARAEAIEAWQAGSADVIGTLADISVQLRPTPMGDDSFDPQNDAFLTNLELRARQVGLDGLARTRAAVQPLETRIREAGLRVRRGELEKDDTNSQYPWRFNSTVELPAPGDEKAAEGTP